MKYKGYEIKSATLRPPYASPVPTQAIYDGERLVAYVESIVLAKRAIDAHIQAGIWQRKEAGKNGT